MAQAKGIADKPILITPKTVLYMIGATAFATVVGYIWVFSTFVTVATFNAHASDFDKYATGQDVKSLKLSVRATNAELWALEGRMSVPGGDSQRNQDRKHALTQQKEEDKAAIECLQSKRQHCLSNMDSG